MILLSGNDIAVGLGKRTNLQGVELLEKVFPGYRIIQIKHNDLHLDVLMTVVGEKKVLADISKLPRKLFEFLKNEGYQLVEAHPHEQETLGCNVLAIGHNRVVAVAENPRTNARLRASGVDVIEVSMPNVIKKGGGPRCLTCPTARD